MGIKYLSNQGEVAEFDIYEIKVGIVTFSATHSRRSIVHPELALQEIKVLAAKYNILIVSVHGGKEGKDALHVKDEAEYFLDEPRGNLVQFAHAAIDM